MIIRITTRRLSLLQIGIFVDEAAVTVLCRRQPSYSLWSILHFGLSSISSVKGLVRGQQQQQQKGKGHMRKGSGRKCLIVCLCDYASYLNGSLHTSTP